MNIGMVCYPSYGGSGVIATELGKNLAERGHNVHFISYDAPFRLARFSANIFFHEVEVMEYPLFRYPPYLLALASKIVEVTRLANLDVLHVHYAIPHAAAAHLAQQMLLRERYLPYLTTLHGTDMTLVGNDPQFFEIARFALESSDGLSAVSYALAQETQKTFGLDTQIPVIYNFVDLEEYTPKKRPDLRNGFASPEEAVIMHISNFRPVKRVEDVVKMFALILKERPARLLMVGDGPDRHIAAQTAQALGVEDLVCFLGRQEQVAEIFGVADLFILPSRTESFGLVALEAMASGVPVIATEVGGLPELIHHGETGYLTKVGDVEAMAEYALYLLNNPQAYAAVARAGREEAECRFATEAAVDAYEAACMQLMNKGNTMIRWPKV